MGLFDKLKKPKDPQRVKGAAMLFCPETDPKKALDRVEELFQIEHAGDRNNITLVQDDMEIILLATCPDDEGENGEYAKNQLEGVAGYVYQNQTGLVEIKRNLFYHLRQCKSLIQVVYSFDSASPAETREKEKQVMEPLLEITEKLQGVITFGDGMTLLDSKGRVILDKAGKSELEYYMPSEVPVPGSWAEDALPEYLERRDRCGTSTSTSPPGCPCCGSGRRSRAAPWRRSAAGRRPCLSCRCTPSAGWGSTCPMRRAGNL